MKNKGFIQIKREFFESFLWNENRIYSKAEAWIDLMQSSRFEAGKEIINNKVIDVQKNEIPISISYLNNRWKWGNTKIRNFIKNLKKYGLINKRTTQGQTIIIICKSDIYEVYKQGDNKVYNNVATRRQQGDNNNINKEKKEINLNNKKEREKKQPPSYESFKNYAVEKMPNVDLLKLELKYESWVENGWVTGKGNIIKNWKSTLLHTLPYLKKSEKNSEKLRIINRQNYG